MGRYLVSGVRRGIGLEVSRLLLAAGHEVWGLLRPGSTVPDGLAGTLSADLSRPEALAATLADQLPTLPSLDGVVHSAGIVRGGTLAETSPEHWAEQFAVNVTAVHVLTDLLLPLLRPVGGTVLVVNSGSGLVARSPLAGYAASKHALRAWADALRIEEPAIRVSSIYPGRVDTGMQHEVRAAEGEPYQAVDYLRPEVVARVVVDVLTLPADAVITDVSLSARPRAGR